MKKKLSILIYSLALGGAERVVSILAKELDKKYDVTIVLMNETVLYKIPKNINIYFINRSHSNESGMKKLFMLPIIGLKYKHFCHKNNIDISLSFMNRPNYAALFSKIFGNKAKIIISERSQPSLQYQSGLQGWINKILIKSLYPKASAVIANSIGNSSDLNKNFKIKNIHTINNPIDLANIEYYSKENDIIKNDTFTFISVGRLDVGKNHSIIIDAMKNINAKLWIIGEGKLKESLKKQIEELNLTNKVFLLGHQKNPFKYMSKADCFVFSSSHEGFPNVLIEALACGLPVISTDCQSGPREILAPNTDSTKQISNEMELCEYGILTPINDCKILEETMLYMLENKNIQNTYKLKSKQRSSDFDKSLITKKFIDVIES